MPKKTSKSTASQIPQRYVDGFVIPIPADKVKDYQKIARKASRIWREYGALDYFEAIGDDMQIKGVVPFTKLSKAKQGETVVFAWITYASRKHRDEVNAKVMADPRIQSMGPENMPFDCKRMAYGGFKVIVQG